MSGLNSTSGGGAWTVTRRNTTYTLNVDVCAVDDPKDGSGSHSGATSFPLPLLILGGLALFLLAAGVVGLIVRRMQGRGGPPTA